MHQEEGESPASLRGGTVSLGGVVDRKKRRNYRWEVEGWVQLRDGYDEF